MEEGTVKSDPRHLDRAFSPGKRFGRRFKIFALISCTNFSGNGHYTAATVKTVAGGKKKGFAPKGIVNYLSDPKHTVFFRTA